jgi:hypothetical protein
MTRETIHSTKGSSIVRALVAAVLVAGLFGLSALGASAQEGPSWFEPWEFEAPSPLAVCEEQFPDTIVDTGPILEDALAESGLPPEVVEDILANASFTLTCEDLFGGGDA